MWVLTPSLRGWVIVTSSTKKSWDMEGKVAKKTKLNPIPPWGGVFLTRSTMNPFTVSTEQGLCSPKLMTLFLLVFAKTQ